MGQWNNFVCEEFVFEGYPAVVVFPEPDTRNGRLAIKTEYWNAFPKAIEIPLLEAGFHLCFIKNKNRFGTAEDLERKARFIKYVQSKYELDDKCVPIGMSCGGMIAINFAATYPEMISSLYLDAPVLNFMSWPLGFGMGQGMNGDFSEILNALSLDNVEEVISYPDMPLYKIPVLIENKIPVVMVAGDSDLEVPYCENGIFLQKAYETSGIAIQVHIKQGCGHHPHGLEESESVRDFILEHSALSQLEKSEWNNVWWEQAPDINKPRILYIGDSISCGIRTFINELSDGEFLCDGFGTSKALDNVYFRDSIRLFGKQQRTRKIILFNNGLHGWHLNDTQEYKEYYEKMVNFLLKEYEDTTLVLLLTTGVADARNERVLVRNECVKEIAKKYNLPMIDLYAASVEYANLHVEDGVHFTDRGYEQLTKSLLEEMNKIEWR